MQQVASQNHHQYLGAPMNYATNMDQNQSPKRANIQAKKRNQFGGSTLNQRTSLRTQSALPRTNADDQNVKAQNSIVNITAIANDRKKQQPR